MLLLIIAVAACSDSDDPDPLVDNGQTQEDDPTDEGQNIPENDEDPPEDCVANRSGLVLDCETVDDQPIAPVQAVQLDTPLTGSLAEGEFETFTVPSGAEIILITRSGDADLVLHTAGAVDELSDFNEDNVLCVANSPFIEDNCTATNTEGELYASVVVFEDSDYTISATSDCSVASVNQWVYRNMLDYYLFADQVPELDPTTYSDPAALMADLRFDTLDPFSGVDDAQTRSAFLEEGRTFGLGAGFGRDATGAVRLLFVYDDSPFGRANLKRGDIWISVGGVPVSSLNEQRLEEIIGTMDNPLVADWVFADGDTGETKTISVAMAEFSINTVLHTDIYTPENFSGRVGYIAFSNFLGTSAAELDEAIGSLAESGATELVLDLRYNGGGFSNVANRLGSQIAGAIVDGQTEASFEYNDVYADLNFTSEYEAVTPTLNLSRVVVLTTLDTASASELITNSLRPYIEVITIGGITRGKPFGSVGRNFCGIVLNAMTIEYLNANGVSVAGGIPADCYAEDDLARNFGLQSGSVEGMLRGAFDYLALGTCETAPTPLASRSKEKPLIDETLQTGVVRESSHGRLSDLLSKSK